MLSTLAVAARVLFLQPPRFQVWLMAIGWLGLSRRRLETSQCHHSGGGCIDL